MKGLKIKLFIVLMFIVFSMFFSNDFGLIDIEKTAIITAVAIDYDGEKYNTSAEIAVPESTNNSSENKKTIITGSGLTVGASLKDIGDKTGWFPQLIFCNLIILGNSFEGQNVITVLDYFAKTLRVQDSALVVMSEKEGKEILETESPLDKLSAFAIQKLLLKNEGFDQKTVKTNVKTFATDYYSPASYGLMPIISIDKENKIFKVNKTALFSKGKKTSELTQEETATYNLINGEYKGSTIELKDIENNVTKEKDNYLITVLKSNSKIEIDTKEEIVKIDLRIYCKEADKNSEYSDETQIKNKPLSEQIKEKAKEKIKENIESIFNKSKESKCDLLKLQERLYRYKHSEYKEKKERILKTFTLKTSIKVEGQK